MIPIKDSVRTKSFAYVNYLLILVNILIFIFELSLGPKLGNFLTVYAVTPSKFLKTQGLSLTRILPLITSAFLHGGFLHIGANMLFLFIFGDNVEDSMGHFRYLFFYILVGILSSLAHIYANPISAVPSLGASGAISGVLGAYILMFPKAKVYTLIFLIIFVTIIEIPAFIFIGLWFLIQLVSGFSTISTNSAHAGGIAYFSHIGGFVAGFILILFFRKKKQVEYMRYY